MKVDIESSWKKTLADEFESEWFAELAEFVQSEYKSDKPIYPAPKNIFRAFNEVPFDKVRVVILGQDPYHGPGQAQGLSFSVPANIKNPPSLVNIFKEIEADLGHKATAETEGGGDLVQWARQGVLLLNASLTVERSKPMSHSKIGWDRLTDAAIEKLSERREGIVFMPVSYTHLTLPTTPYV